MGGAGATMPHESQRGTVYNSQILTMVYPVRPLSDLPAHSLPECDSTGVTADRDSRKGAR